MKNEQQQLNDMYVRVRQVFSEQEFESLAPQQRALLDSAIQRVADKEGLDALTVPRLEGIKELVTQHLWSPELTNAAQIHASMAGFECLSPQRNFYTATTTEPVMDQILNGIEDWTQLSRTFPLAIGLRTGDRLFLLFRNVEEDLAATESTILAMLVAYDADEMFICSASDALGGLKAFMATMSSTTDGQGIFFELTESKDKWEIGNPVGNLDLGILDDYPGASAFKVFHNVAERSRQREAQQSLKNWQPLYDWRF